MAERLSQIVDLSFDDPIYDWHVLAALFLGDSYPTTEETDDLMASIARYLRVPWGYLEEQTLPRLLQLSRATGRLLRAENGKRDPLDLRAASEENR